MLAKKSKNTFKQKRPSFSSHSVWGRAENNRPQLTDFEELWDIITYLQRSKHDDIDHSNEEKSYREV